MPTHRISRASLHEDLIEIERKQCERVLWMVLDTDDSDFYIVETRYLTADNLETRPA